MFENGFAALFRAVDRIRGQLDIADVDFRQYLADELICIQRLGEQYIDYWMALDEQICELFETYELGGMAPPPSYPSLQVQPQLSNTISDHASESKGGKGKSEGSGRPAGHAVDIAPQGSKNGDDWADLAFEASDAISVSFRKGLAYYDLFMFDEAAKSLQQVVNAGESIVGRLYLAASYAAQENNNAALRELEEVRRHTRESLFLCAADEIEAQVCVVQQRPQDAVAALARIAQRIPKYEDVWYNLGVCHALAGDYAAAESALEQGIELAKDDAEVVHLLAVVQMRQTKLSTAMETCSAGLEAHPRHASLLVLKSMLLKAIGDHERCERVCQTLVTVHPQHPHAWSLSAWLALKSGRIGRAISLMKMRLSIAPSDAQALLQLGVLELLGGNLERAERVLLRCFPDQPNKSLLWIALGHISALRGDGRQAHTRLLRAMRDPRKPIRRLGLYCYAQLLLTEDRNKEAEKYLRAAALLGPKNPAIYHGLSVAAERQGRFLEAEKYLRLADDCQSESSTVQ